MSKKRMNTIGTIIDTSGCAPKGNTGGGLAHNAPRDPQPQTEAGRKIFDKLCSTIEDTKKNYPLYKISKWAEKAEKLLAKGDIEALQKLSGSIDKVLDKATTASWGNSVVSAGLALAYAIKEVFLPTNIIDVIPVGKIASKGKKALSAIQAAEKSKAARKGARGGHVKVRRMEKPDIGCFKTGKKIDKNKFSEYDRQLKRQENGLNNMTVEEYIKGREAYKNIGRGSGTEQVKARSKEQKRLAKEFSEDYQKQGMSATHAKQMANKRSDEVMKELAALHEPDMVAGGKNKIGGFGDSQVNKSIGGGWKGKVDKLDEEVAKIPAIERGKTRMNVDLKRCK